MCDLNNNHIYSAEPDFMRKDMSSTYMGLMREPGKILNCNVFL